MDTDYGYAAPTQIPDMAVGMPLDTGHPHTSMCPATVAPCRVLVTVERTGVAPEPEGDEGYDEGYSAGTGEGDYGDLSELIAAYSAPPEELDETSGGQAGDAVDVPSSVDVQPLTDTDDTSPEGMYQTLLVGWDTCGCPMICCPESGSVRHLDAGEMLRPGSFIFSE